jgi:uncharacterized protein YdhG (YjbR/CyaY superfamily)
MSKPTTVDAYMAGLSPELRDVGEAVRTTIKKALPEAAEVISYSIPTYRIGKRNVLYFAVWKKHVGVYPIIIGSDAFEAKVGPYRATKATVQLPLKDLPHALLAEIARHQAGALA